MLRSLLFVPGDRPSWYDKAVGYRPDAIILDLEDAVVDAEKANARTIVRNGLPGIRPKLLATYVRVNALDTGLTKDDLVAIACPELTGIMAPKVESAADLRALDELLAYAEGRNGLELGTIQLLPIIETANAMRSAYELAKASPRVTVLLGGASNGGDMNRAVGYVWTPEETESLYIRSKIVLDARAAGLRQVVAGLWTDIRDLDGLRAHALRNRQLGYTGEVVIHPSHVAVVNEVYSPTKEELAYYRGLVEAMAQAEREGRAAVTYQGQMVDYAMVKTAREVLAATEDRESRLEARGSKHPQAGTRDRGEDSGDWAC